MLISSHLSPLTLEVVGAPISLQQYLSILPCLLLPSGNLQTPFSFIPWCYLPISSSVFSFFLLSLPPAELFSPCQRILRYGQTIGVSVSLPWLGDHHALRINLEIWVDVAHQPKFHGAIRPGVWGLPKPPLGSRGKALVGGPGGLPAENEFKHFWGLKIAFPGI